MKKLVLTAAAALFISGISMAIVAPEGDSNDTNEASHQVGINVNSFAILDIETSGDMNFNLNPVVPTEAGDAISFTDVTNNDHWLNYSSIVTDGKSRSISAKINDVLPAGVSLQLAATTPTSGKGTLGASAVTTATTLISTGDGVKIIDNIGSCYTEDGSGKGSQLTYSVIVNEDSYASILTDNYSVTVTYTISDEN